MSDTSAQAGIEDLLTSVRRLVADQVEAPKLRPRKDRLVLTPSKRIDASAEQEDQAQAPLPLSAEQRVVEEPEAAADDLPELVAAEHEAPLSDTSGNVQASAEQELKAAPEPAREADLDTEAVVSDRGYALLEAASKHIASFQGHGASSETGPDRQGGARSNVVPIDQSPVGATQALDGDDTGALQREADASTGEVNIKPSKDSAPYAVSDSPVPSDFAERSAEDIEPRAPRNIIVTPRAQDNSVPVSQDPAAQEQGEAHSPAQPFPTQPTLTQAQPEKAPSFNRHARLEATIAELEAAVLGGISDWEPDGSELDGDPTLAMDVPIGFGDASPVSSENQAPLAEAVEPESKATDVRAGEPEEQVKASSAKSSSTCDASAARPETIAEEEALIAAARLALASSETQAAPGVEAPREQNEEALRQLVAEVLREELRGELGQRVTRNMRKLVRREIYRILTLEELKG